MRDGAPFESTINIPVNFPSFTVSKADYGSTPFGSQLVLSNVPWRSAPSLGEVVAAYPKKARAEKIGGRATLDCDMTEAATLRRCTVLTEEPNGYGFGRAARTLADRFAGARTMAGDKTVKGAAVHIPFAFDPKMLEAERPEVRKLRWTALPSAEQFAAAFPRAAFKTGVLTARIAMVCEIQPDGSLTRCVVEAEEPSGLGFKEAAVGVSTLFRVSGWSDEGLPVVGGKAHVPIRFQLEEAPAADETR